MILTTSQLLTTGVDAPTVKNVVLVRVVNSMTEFKQIIGRGTRVRDDYGKLFFTSSTTPARRRGSSPTPTSTATRSSRPRRPMDENGKTIEETVCRGAGATPEDEEPFEVEVTDSRQTSRTRSERRKYYVDGGQVAIAAHLVYELDPDGKQLRVVQFTDYTAEKVRTLFANAARAARRAGPTR